MAVTSIQQLTFIIKETSVTCTVKRSKKRRRTLAMVMDPQEGIVVLIPWRTSDASLHEFIYSHQRWILARVSQLQGLPDYKLATGDQLSYLGGAYPLRVVEGVKRRTACIMKGNCT